jgi:ABC-type multidrug transport system ATPase subunit
MFPYEYDKKDYFISCSACLFSTMVELKIHQLTKRYGSQVVLDNLNFLGSKSILGIAGSNGSGKSTLMQCMSGLLKPASGTITWMIDQQPMTPQALNGQIGYVAPYIELYESLSVTENIQFIQDLKRNGADKHPQDSLQLLTKCQAETFTEKQYGELSTGQRQRVKLAAAMIQNPTILFLDEPGSNLDKKGKDLIENIVLQFNSMGKMVVIASNQADELHLCDEIIDLDS